jgi:hypothetical protein
MTKFLATVAGSAAVLLSCLSGGPPASAATGTPLAGYARTGSGAGYLYDSAGGPVSVVKVFKGVYDVDFYGLAKLGDVDSNEQVTAFGSKVACQDGGQVVTPDYFGEQINCYTSAGAPVNALFDLSVTHVQTRPHGFYDYATDVWPGRSRDLAESYDSAHGSDYVRHLGAGRYRVTMGGPSSSGTHGTVKVSAFEGGPTANCVIAGWHGSTSGQVIDIDCFSGAHLANTGFAVVYASATNILGISGVTSANALVGSSGKVQTQYDSDHAATVTARLLAPGRYKVELNGSDESADSRGDIQVSAVGPRATRCVVESWGPMINPGVRVSCFSDSGAPTDSAFTLQWVVASAP